MRVIPHILIVIFNQAISKTLNCSSNYNCIVSFISSDDYVCNIASKVLSSCIANGQCHDELGSTSYIRIKRTLNVCRGYTFVMASLSWADADWHWAKRRRNDPIRELFSLFLRRMCGRYMRMYKLQIAPMLKFPHRSFATWQSSRIWHLTRAQKNLPDKRNNFYYYEYFIYLY